MTFGGKEVPVRAGRRSAVGLAVGVFGVLLALVVTGWRPLLRLDEAGRDDLHGYALRHPAFVTAMRLVSDLGSARAYTVVFTLVVGWLAWRRRPRPVLFAAATMLGGALLNRLAKLAVERARPVLPDPVARAPGLSFPSGHAQSAVVACTVLLLVLGPALSVSWRRVAVAAAVLVVAAVGFSRVALGVHYVSDVLGGYALGVAWAVGMAAAFRLTDTAGCRRKVGRG